MSIVERFKAVTFTHAGVNSGNAVSIESAKLEWVSDNNIAKVPIPAFQDDSEPNIGLLNMKTFNITWLITGYIVKKQNNNPATKDYGYYATPQAEKAALYEMQYKTGDSDGVTQVSLKYRDEDAVPGYIKKISIVDSFSGEFSTLNNGEIAYEIQIMFIQGYDFSIE